MSNKAKIEDASIRLRFNCDMRRLDDLDKDDLDQLKTVFYEHLFTMVDQLQDEMVKEMECLLERKALDEVELEVFVR